LATFKKCSENILEGLADKIKTATVSERLPQRNKIGAAQNAKKGKSEKNQKPAKAAQKAAKKSKKN